MTDHIELTGIEVETVIGVHDFEQRRTRPLRIDLVLYANLAPAGASDALDDTMDYAAVTEAVREFATGARFALVEAFADQLARQLLRDFPVARIALTAHKPGAVPGVGVAIRIERGG